MNKRLIGMVLLLPTTIAGVVGYWNSIMKMAQTPPRHTPITLSRPVESVDAGKSVGYVHLKPLLHVHPLAEQLATDDRQLYTLRILSTQDTSVDAHRDILVAQARLNTELKSAATQAQERLKRRAAELTKEEHRELERLVLAAQKQQRQRPQAAEAIAQADASMTAHALQHYQQFLQGISAEERAAIRSAEQGLDTQAKVALEAKAAQLAQDETTLATQVAQKDADERIRLRVRQANVVLSDADAQVIKDRLNDLDQGELLTLATKRAADHTVLQQLADDLRSHRISSATLAAQNTQAAGQEAVAVAGQAPSPPTAMPVQVEVSPAPLDGELRKRLMRLKQSYQSRFDVEQQESIKVFHAKQAELQGQFTTLGQVDAEQREATQLEVAHLDRQRRQLYATMIADIRSALSRVAAERGIDVVLVDPLGVAPDVVDLTSDVARSLAHEAR